MARKVIPQWVQNRLKQIAIEKYEKLGSLRRPSANEVRAEFASLSGVQQEHMVSVRYISKILREMSKPALAIVVDGQPVSQPRPRVVRTSSGKSHTYMPSEYTYYKEMVAWKIRAALGFLECDGSTRWSIILHFHLGGKRKRNDIEKLTGTIMDALQMGGLYKDDEQVDRILVNKRRGAKKPRVEIQAEEL
jgi:Holliday junction resolvase RusA-like endonuclease